jgi:Flp pilus assembly pilin Flp
MRQANVATVARDRLRSRSGQIMVEYGVMFTIIILVIIAAAITYFKPAMQRFFGASGNILDRATQTVTSTF